jgi:hypothetical protein
MNWYLRRSSSVLLPPGALFGAAPRLGTAQERPEVVQQALAQADKLFDGARGLYEKAKAAASVPRL